MGGGTTFNIPRAVAEGFKVPQLQGRVLHSLRAFYLATLSRALYLDDRIGNVEPGKEADSRGCSNLKPYLSPPGGCRKPAYL